MNSGDGSGERNTVAVKAGDKGDVTGTNLVWQSKKATCPYVPCMLTWGDHVYYLEDHGFAGCFAARTGEVVYHERLGTAWFSASPVLVDGKIYAVNENGDVFVYPAEPKLKVLAKNSIGEPVLASPAVADNRLYIRGKSHLFCIGKPAAR